MNTEYNHEILALDSLYDVLTWYDRCWLHLHRFDKQSGPPSPRILALLKVITDNHWRAPQRRAGQDRCGQYEHYGEWLEITDYAANNPKITEQILKLKI